MKVLLNADFNAYVNALPAPLSCVSAPFPMPTTSTDSLVSISTILYVTFTCVIALVFPPISLTISFTSEFIGNIISLYFFNNGFTAFNTSASPIALYE